MSGFDHLRTWLKTWTESGALPGAALGIYDEFGNELFYENASGSDLIAQGKEYSRDTLFRIYSMTKPITTVAALILVDRGQLSVEDEVYKYIPSFKDIKVAAGGTVEEPQLEALRSPLQLRHLLSHTSGISYGIFGNNLNDQFIKRLTGESWKIWYNDLSVSELVERVSQAPLCFHPGQRFHYSLSTDVLGHIVEIVSKKSLDKFFLEEIFEPLDMGETFFQVPPHLSSRLADCYEVAPGMAYKSSLSPERDRVGERRLLAGGGGLVSSMRDYVKFTSMLLRQGKYYRHNSSSNSSEKNIEQSLLSSDLIKLMASNQLVGNKEIAEMCFENGFSETVGAGVGFGFGVSVLTRPAVCKGGSLSSEGEYGWGGVAGTNFFIDPVRKIASIFMTQVIAAAAVYPIRPQVRYLTCYALDQFSQRHEGDKDDKLEEPELLINDSW